MHNLGLARQNDSSPRTIFGSPVGKRWYFMLRQEFFVRRPAPAYGKKLLKGSVNKAFLTMRCSRAADMRDFLSSWAGILLIAGISPFVLQCWRRADGWVEKLWNFRS